MTISICHSCAKEVNTDLSHCPYCRAMLSRVSPPGVMLSQADLATEHLNQARTCLQQGDIVQALCYAREALTLGADDSCTHALLGQLYELQANMTAAQYHFQSALHVTSPQHADEDATAPLLVATPPPPPRSEPIVLLLVLMSCIVFSGLAALFAFHPAAVRTINQSRIIQTPLERPALPSTPPWTWHVPSAIPDDRLPENATAPLVHPDDTITPKDSAPLSKSIPNPDVPPTTTVLGPAAHTHNPVNAPRATLEEADKAYFSGDYERAISMYEVVLAQDTAPGPRLFQDLAWCYQQLGNSEQAANNLQKAILGYQALLTTDTANTTAQQAKSACEHALQSLRATRDHK